ncbi:YpiF family protein [Paenisporosarcina sp. TG-14]|uniref:YpiF family protein n=1 Tax=Paenisporosarcina sp. TG-14 TaxID=1231057 RepID=UPI0002DEEB00|nr:YpiF family protein [Paenisporosarcina sp. TG-14]
MYWNSKDVSVFLDQKEFIDTAVIPLLLIDGQASQVKQNASSAEFLMALTVFIENQFKGRVVLLPPVSYTPKSSRQQLGNEWSEMLKEAGFKHLFFVSSDMSWGTEANALNVIYTPSIPLEHMDQRLRQSVLEDQLRQIIPVFAKRWAISST